MYQTYFRAKAGRKRKSELQNVFNFLKIKAMQTGENEQGLRKILDMTRLISIVILVLHFYYYCYAAFEHWHLTLASY